MQNQARVLYKYVFGECRKPSSETNGWRSSDNKVFQAAGPDAENAQNVNARPSIAILNAPPHTVHNFQGQRLVHNAKTKLTTTFTIQN